MEVKTIALVLILSASFAVGAKRNQDNIEALIEAAGYESEVHYAETQDGYLLKVHRIKVKTTSAVPRKGPVFILHGLLATAADYLMTGAEKALPYLLSNNGYDVWLGNVRGSDHSLKHKTLSVQSKEFWNFSFHEIGYYDLPSMFDLMLQKMKAQKGFYVGHSQGGPSAMVLLSMRPEYNQKFMQVHLLAPAVFMGHLPHPLARVFMNDIDSFKSERDSFDLIIDPKSKRYVDSMNKAMCQNSMMSSMCAASVGAICGKNKEGIELDVSILPTIISYMSHSSSIKQLAHFLQLFKSGLFRQFDYEKKNKAFYNSTTPPSYDLSKVKAPAYIYSGSCDLMVSERDIEHLKEVLPNVRKYKSFKNLNHCDFNYGKNMRALLFEDIVQDMNAETDN